MRIYEIAPLSRSRRAWSRRQRARRDGVAHTATRGPLVCHRLAQPAVPPGYPYDALLSRAAWPAPVTDVLHRAPPSVGCAGGRLRCTAAVAPKRSFDFPIRRWVPVVWATSWGAR